MMMHYFIDPEVAGGWGPNTVVDAAVHPPIVSKLHYRFDGWLGSDLLETFPCFIVSEKLKNDLVLSDLSGFSIETVEVDKSDCFLAGQGGENLPNFYWLQIKNSDTVSDFAISSGHRLLVSEEALALLKRHNIEHADIQPT